MIRFLSALASINCYCDTTPSSINLEFPGLYLLGVVYFYNNEVYRYTLLA